ncbi:MAG: glucose-1-phosphate cytidylyltransferase [Anaerolineae bacterium]|jgi:glucose-1-phosphate cytidylyltransferase|nr:glucose-1-phosphate cytidylyltransferase [Anaerolineae bacterium]
MKVVILAGGLGTRLSEETARKPKPMVEIGDRPMLWHIMSIYAAHGFKEFVVALGYKGEVIKDYFLNYHHRSRSLSVNLQSGEVSVHNGSSEDWTVHLLDTGAKTQTGGRVKRAAAFIGEEPFMLTYGDGVSNVNISELVRFHHEQKKLVTITAVRPPARFGQMIFDGERVSEFVEKPQIGEGWINGGFFVLQPEIVNYIDGDQSIFEREPLEQIAKKGELAAYRHQDFWHCMDTLRDVKTLNSLWLEGNAPWKS